MDYITGANGFIGSRLMARLSGNVRSIPHELISLTDLVSFSNFYFLSSYGTSIDQDDVSETIKSNVLDVFSAISKATRFNFNSFLFTSSSSVKLTKKTVYARSKKAAEQILLAYMDIGLPIAIVRPFTVTGVGEQKKRLIPTLIRSCMTGEKMPFVSSPVHDYIDVDDVVGGIINLTQNRARGVFELGTGIKHSNEEVLRLVEEITGKKANVERVDSLRPYDNEKWVSTNFRARSWGWLPKKTLKQSIKEMVGAYDK